VYHGGSVAGDEAVIKIAINGRRQNEQAVETWTEMDDAARACVAPVIAWSPDRQWIVQRKAGAGRPGTVDTVVDRLAQAGWRMSDPNLENVGYLDGRPVITDLGLLYRR
jgi:anti-sigma factor RsiW